MAKYDDGSAFWAEWPERGSKTGAAKMEGNIAQAVVAVEHVHNLPAQSQTRATDAAAPFRFRRRDV
jgi:hypothetical protein